MQNANYSTNSKQYLICAKNQGIFTFAICKACYKILFINRQQIAC